MTAYGYAGDDAIRPSMTDQESTNSALMNAKMHAEVFSMLGWGWDSVSMEDAPAYLRQHIAENRKKEPKPYKEGLPDWFL